MSHQSSVARDGKRISDIKTLSESARITSAQLRKLPTPIADSVSLTVSGTFIGYQGFMSTSIVNPLGYGSDKIFDPKDNIPYTYRVNQHYDQAQFLAYLENPRFERTIEIAGRKFHGNEKIGMNEGGLDGGGSGRGDDNLNRGNQEVGVDKFGGQLKGIQETASQSLLGTFSDFGGMLSASLREATEGTMEGMKVSQAYAGDIMYPFSTAYALDSSTVDLSSRYPYSAGDRLGIFLSKGSKQPLQNGVTGTGSRDISLSDSSNYDILVGSSGNDEYFSTSISTGSLNALKNGSFDEKSLLGMNSGTGSGSGSGGGDSGGGGGGPVSHILTMGEYSIMGNTYYGYIGPLTISLYATYGVTITTITPGSLIDDTVDGYVIDTFILDSNYQSPVTILAGSTNMPSNIAFETPYASIACTPQSSFLDVTPYGCTGSTSSTDFYVGSQHELEISLPPPEVVCTNASNVTDESYFTFNASTKTITAYNGPSDVVIPCNIGGVNVTAISSSVFQNKGLNSAVIPNGITNIGSYAFYGNNISILDLPDSIDQVGSYAFAFNQISSLTLSQNLLYIPYNGFRNNQLSSLTIPGGVVGIAEGAFVNNQISSLTIPSSVTSIGGGVSGGAFQYNNFTHLTIPSSVTSIGDRAFANNQITDLVLLSTGASIGSEAFRYNQISSLSFAPGTTFIGGLYEGFYAFANNQLTTVVIPQGMATIGSLAFAYNNLTSVTLPNTITHLGVQTFDHQFSDPGTGTIYGPASGYVKNTYGNAFDMYIFTTYIDQF
ncbi:MAG: leucine-rich repeat domain-containing protein [Candidatus Gracilibacteria bacterium]